MPHGRRQGGGEERQKIERKNSKGDRIKKISKCSFHPHKGRHTLELIKIDNSRKEGACTRRRRQWTFYNSIFAIARAQRALGGDGDRQGALERRDLGVSGFVAVIVQQR